MMKRNILVTLASVISVFPAFAIAGPGQKYGEDHKKSKPLPDCPVMGEPVNLAISTETSDGPVFFCCDGCVKKYNANPAKYASAADDQRKALAGRLRVQTACPVSGESPDPEMSVKHNGEEVYFCCGGCVSKFRKDPKKYASALANSYTYQTICPVTEKTIDPTSFTELADGRKIYYCCDGCEGRLFGSPAKYAKNLANQGFLYNWAKIKKIGDATHSGHGDHDGQGHHDHDH